MKAGEQEGQEGQEGQGRGGLGIRRITHCRGASMISDGEMRPESQARIFVSRTSPILDVIACLKVRTLGGSGPSKAACRKRRS